MLTHTWLTRCASASRVLFPDAQIEYVTAVGGGRRCNVEVASEHYGVGDIRAKAAAGFQMYAASGRAASFVRRAYCPRTRSTPSDGLILRWTLAGSRRS